jgi:N-acetylneuraminic acid mutarotase
VYNGRVYLAGGEGPSGSIRTTVYYATFQADGSLSAWSTATSLPQPRHYHAMVEANGYLYTIGGYTVGGLLTQNTIEYAPINSNGSLGSWSATNLPVALGSPMAVVSGGRLYVLGGHNGSAHQTTVYYATVNADGSLGSWNTTTSLPQGLSWGGAVVANGRIYTTGGATNSGQTAATYSAVINANGTLGSWNTLSSLPKAIANHVLLRNGNNLYVAGGWDDSSSQSKVYYAPLQADGTLGSWTATTDLPQTLHDHAGATYGNRLYILGGFNHSIGSYQSTVYLMATSP